MEIRGFSLKGMISECSFGGSAKEKRGRKEVPKVWRTDPTSLERHHKLFAVCSSLKDVGSSHVDEDCSAGRCWRKCGGIG